MFTDLLVLNKSREKPREGDVFVICTKPNLYFPCKVIETNIESSNSFIQGWNLICVYNFEMVCPEMPSPDFCRRFLIPPIVVNNQGWLKGYFLTVGNQPVLLADVPRSFGFYDDLRDIYFDYKGNILHKEPEHYSSWGLGSYGAVGAMVQKALVTRDN